jgi:hypothetical protein
MGYFSPNIIFVPDQLEDHDIPLAFPTEFATAMGEIHERVLAAQARDAAVEEQLAASLANESREQAMRLLTVA